MTDQCWLCHFYATLEPPLERDRDGFGFCKRYPPTLRREGGTDPDDWIQAVVEGDGWCGEFRAIGEQNMSLQAERMVSVVPPTQDWIKRLSARTMSALVSAGLGDATKDQARCWNDIDILRIPDIGKRSLNEIREALKEKD